MVETVDGAGLALDVVDTEILHDRVRFQLHEASVAAPLKQGAQVWIVASDGHRFAGKCAPMHIDRDVNVGDVLHVTIDYAWGR